MFSPKADSAFYARFVASSKTLRMRMVTLTPIALALLTLSSCSSSPQAPPKTPQQTCPVLAPKLEITASARVNATTAGEGRPVQLRVYQLKHDAALQNATFEEIWQEDRSVLEGDLVGVVQLTAYPGKTEVVELEPDKSANKLGVVALFREPQGKDWFVTYELDSTPPAPPCPETAPRIRVFLDRMQIQDGQGRSAAPESEL